MKGSVQSVVKELNKNRGNKPYDGAFQITNADKNKDGQMKKAAEASAKSDYNLFTQNCIDVPSAALTAGGYNPGTSNTVAPEGMEMQSLNPIPNMRFIEIELNNKNVGEEVNLDETKK